MVCPEMQQEIDELVSQIEQGFELGKMLNPSFSRQQYLDAVRKEYRELCYRARAVEDSGQHPSEKLVIACLAHSQILKEDK